MKDLTAAEKLYEVENLMRASVGLQQGLCIEQVEELSVDMQLMPVLMQDSDLLLRITCGNLELRVEALGFEALAEAAFSQAHRTMDAAITADPVIQGHQRRPSYLRLVP